MDITLNYSEDTNHLAYGLISTGEETIKLAFDQLDIHINKLAVKLKICAEFAIHEINEAIILETIRKASIYVFRGEISRNIAHNLNAESLGEYEQLSPIDTLMVYRNSDRLANIEGTHHKKTLSKIRNGVYKIA